MSDRRGRCSGAGLGRFPLRLGPKPLDVSPHADPECGLRLPPELRPRALARHVLAGEVLAAHLGVDDPAFAEHVAHRLGDLEHRHAFVAGEVVDAVGRRGLQRRDYALGEVLDVDELARLKPAARDIERFAGHGRAREVRHDRPIARPRPIGDAEAQDRAGKPVVLGV